jgi:hypothetical protein
LARAGIVTGAGTGIGRAVAERLERGGVSVLSVDLEPDPAGPGRPSRPTCRRAPGTAPLSTALSRSSAGSTSWSRTRASSTSLPRVLGPGGRAVTGAPLVMDLGWTAR